VEYVAITDSGELSIEVIEGGRKVVIDGQVHEVDIKDIGSQSLFSLLVDGGSYEVLVEEQSDGFRVLLGGRLHTVRVESQDRYRLSKLVRPAVRPKGEMAIRAPIPGMVVAVPVSAGQAVSAGEVLLVLESMKMENELRAPQDGTVQAVNVAPGELVSAGQVLAVVE
jgi:acetyl/propionyl-CoA carboxylase alpha subunit